MGISYRIGFTLAGTLALAACGGGSSSGMGGGTSMGSGGQTSMGTGGQTSMGTGGAASTSSSSSSTTTSSSSGTGTGGMGTGGGAGCQADCISNNMPASQKFEAYELNECGCKPSVPCATQCTGECTDPTTLMQTSPCGTCLLNEANKGLNSTCTTKAALSDCLPDSTCAPFVTCIQGCP